MTKVLSDKCQLFGSYTVYVSTLLQREGSKHGENNYYTGIIIILVFFF